MSELPQTIASLASAYRGNQTDVTDFAHQSRYVESFHSESMGAQITNGLDRRGTNLYVVEGGDRASVHDGTKGRRSVEEEEVSIRHMSGQSYPVSVQRASAELDNTSRRGVGPGYNSHCARTRDYIPLHTSIYSDRWIVNHHKDGFITPIRRKKNSLWSRSFSGQTLDKGTTAQLRELEAKIQHETSQPSRVTDGNVGTSSNTEQGGWRRPNNERTFKINLAELQRMRLRKLQWRLVKHVKNLRSLSPDHEDPADWETDLESYIKAVQDYDYMVKCKEMPRDPFLVTGERMIDDYVIRTIFNDLVDEDFPNPETTGVWEEDNEPIGGTRGLTIRNSWFDGFKTRLGMAAMGAFFLIAPMWLMVLNNTLYTGLVSTTSFVVIFGVILALYSDSPKDVLLGTAAYAAVLVVFVGLGQA